MGVGTTYRKSNEKIIQLSEANIITNRGVLRLYGTRLDTASTTPTYLLNTAKINTDDYEISWSFSGTKSWESVGTYYFKTDEFAKAVKVDGAVIIELAYGINNTGANDLDARVKVEVQRRSGGGLVEELGEETTEENTFTAGTTTSINKTIAVEVSNKTVKSGEQLYIIATLELDGTTISGSAQIGSDPFDNDQVIVQPSSHDSTHTAFIVNVPVKLTI